MPRSAARAATRNAPARKNASSASATTSAIGTPKTSAPNYGTSTTPGSAPASTSACSRSPTGPNLTSGNTSKTEQLEIPSIYFAHTRETFERDGMLYAYRHGQELLPGETPSTRTVRYRTVGDMSCTGGDPLHRHHHPPNRRRNRRHPHHRTRRNPRRRQNLRSRHGRPQKSRILLEMASASAQLRDPAAVRRARRATSAGTRATLTARSAGGVSASAERRSGSRACRAPASRRSPPRSRSSCRRRAAGPTGSTATTCATASAATSASAATTASENARRVAELALLFADAGSVALVCLVSPYAADRRHARELHEQAGLDFVEVFVNTSLEECARRDVKGLYAKARGRRARPTSPASARPTSRRSRPTSS